MSMAFKSSNLDGWKSTANLQTEGPTLTPPSSWKSLEETEALGSAPSHSPSWSPVRQISPGNPKTWYCLGIHVTLIKEIWAAPPLPHAWTAPVVEDMLCHGMTGLTEAVVTGPGRTVLFYGRWSLGEGLSLGEARDTAFTLTGDGSWVGKWAHLAAKPLTIWEGLQVITKAITEHRIEARGPGHPCYCLATPQPFRFYHGDEFPQEEHIKDASFDHQSSHHRPQWGRDHDWQQRNPRQVWPEPPSPSPDHGFESDEVWYQQLHQYHHNLTSQKAPSIPIMADITGKLEATWKSIYPSLKMWTQRMQSPTKVGDGSWLYTNMQGAQTVSSFPTPSIPYKSTPGELVKSSRTDITLDDVLTILDKHYNNVKALDALNQELFQLWMGKKGDCIRLGCSFIKAPPYLGHFISRALPSWSCGWVEAWLLLWWATQMAQGHGGLPEGQPTGEDILWLSLGHEGSQKGRLHGTVPKPKPKATSFSPCRS